MPETNTHSIFAKALWLRGKGISVFPIPHGSKQPVINWKRYQTQLPTEEELQKWFSDKESNYAIVTGQRSGIVVIDCDSEETGAEIQKAYPTPWVQRTSRGKQFFYKHPGVRVPNKVHVNGHALDIRGDGGYVVGPGSVHPTGAVYAVEKPWEGSPQDLPVFPTELLEKPRKNTSPRTMGDRSRLMARAQRYLANIEKPIEGEGSDDKVYRVLGRLMGHGKDDIGLRQEEVLPLLKEWQPSFDEEWWLEKTTNFETYAQNKSQSDSQHLGSPVCISQVQSKPIEWLWEPRIPIGNITILEGDPGIGKSLMTACFAADVSLGRNGFREGNVLVLSAEDDPGDTIKPRLLAAGADCNRIFVDAEPFGLDVNGLRRLEAWIVEKRPILVLIDPIFAYIGGKTNVNADNEVRQVLSPLKEIAAKYKVSVLLVRHLTKSGKDKAIYRGSGSMGFTGAARSVLLAGRDLKDKTQFGLIHIKCNVAQLAPGLGYKIESHQVEGTQTARIVWTGESKIQTEDILGSEFDVVAAKPSVLDEAKDFLRRELLDGPRAAEVMEKEATRWGISATTLKRAKRELGVESIKNGRGNWTWHLSSTEVDLLYPRVYQDGSAGTRVDGEDGQTFVEGQST